MLEARALTKRYDGLLAVDHVSFAVQRGEIVAYLGPNGSGKSTTVNSVMSFAVRMSMALPIERRANWIFRVTEEDAVRRRELDAAAQAIA